MFNFNYYLTLYMYLIVNFILFYYFKHLLLTMISLEFIMIFVFLNMFMIFSYLNMSMNSMIFYLSMVVCEGGLGLSLLVLMVRMCGNDYLNSLSLMNW